MLIYLSAARTLPCHHRSVPCRKITMMENVVGEMGHYSKLHVRGLTKFDALRHNWPSILVGVNIAEPHMRWTIGFTG